MSEDISFNRALDLAPGVVDDVAPGVRRILADNPGPFTFKGTLSYIIGRGNVAIIDPGPRDERHTAALLDAVRGETVTHIIITHTHRDHSPGAAPLKAATGAPTFGAGPHRLSRPLFIGETKRLDTGGDMDFAPDHRIADGDVIAGDGWALEAIATPGHGDVILNAPDFVARFIAHRRGREASILHRLGKGETDIPALVRAIYVGLDPRLAGAARLSTLAHLEDLTARGLVATDGAPSISGRYRLPP